MPDALPAPLRPVPVPSAALLARLAPLTPVPGRPDLVAHYAPDVFALWQAWEEECGAPQAVPFWAAVWPAGQLLARVVQAEPAWVRGQTVLDLGCGSGVAGIAALRAGVTTANGGVPIGALRPTRVGLLGLARIDLAPATIDGLKSGYVSATLDQLLYLQGFIPVLQCVMTAKYKMPGLSLNTGAARLRRRRSTRSSS